MINIQKPLRLKLYMLVRFQSNLNFVCIFWIITEYSNVKF
jgi:hypothetical protein